MKKFPMRLIITTAALCIVAVAAHAQDVPPPPKVRVGPAAPTRSSFFLVVI
jgi:hypothetical protein